MNDTGTEHRLTKLERDTEINVEIIKEQLSGIREDLKEINNRIESRITWFPIIMFAGLGGIVALIKLLP